jgi:hypothetical protein
MASLDVEGEDMVVLWSVHVAKRSDITDEPRPKQQ